MSEDRENAVEVKEHSIYGITPRSYLLMRGWTLAGDQPLREQQNLLENPFYPAWVHPVYSTLHDFKDALMIALLEEVEAIGGFECLINAANETGKGIRY